MAESKKYTLTRKNSVTGPVDNPYNYTKGDVIDQKKYDKLVERHKDQFEEGAKDILKPNESPADKLQNKRLAEFDERISALEEKVGIKPEADDSEKDDSDADDTDEKAGSKSSDSGKSKGKSEKDSKSDDSGKSKNSKK